MGTQRRNPPDYSQKRKQQAELFTNGTSHKQRGHLVVGGKLQLSLQAAAQWSTLVQTGTEVGYMSGLFTKMRERGVPGWLSQPGSES